MLFHAAKEYLVFLWSMSMMDQENAPITVGEEQTDNALFLRRHEENASTSLNQKHLINRKLEILVAVNTQDGIYRNGGYTTIT